MAFTVPNKLSPFVLQASGLSLILGGAFFWAFTGRASPELITAGVALSTAGLVAQSKDGNHDANKN